VAINAATSWLVRIEPLRLEKAQTKTAKYVERLAKMCSKRAEGGGGGGTRRRRKERCLAGG
jgi:hypothetical protein